MTGDIFAMLFTLVIAVGMVLSPFILMCLSANTNHCHFHNFKEVTTEKDKYFICTKCGKIKKVK